MKLLCETAYNLLVDNIVISRAIKDILRPKKHVLIKLVRSTYNVRKEVLQKPGNIKLIQILAKVLVGTTPEDIGPQDHEDHENHDHQET